MRLLVNHMQGKIYLNIICYKRELRCKMKRLSQSGSSNFCPELRKNALLISQSHFSNFVLRMISIIKYYTKSATSVTLGYCGFRRLLLALRASGSILYPIVNLVFL